MSEPVGIVCPVCRSKLRLKGSVLSKATVPCPKCGTTLDVPKSETPASPIPQSSPPTPAAIPQARKAAAPLASAPPVSKPASSASNSNRLNSSPSAEPPRKPKKPMDDIPNPYGDDVFDGSEDFFSGGNSDDLNSYGTEPDPYGSQTSLPPRKRQKTTQSLKSNAPSEFSADAGSTRRGGFLSWVGFGLLAAVAGIILQTVLGYTNYLLPLLLATIATGSMVGAAVRYAAGQNNGWGPGIVAVLIAAFAIFAGRVGAFSVSPDVEKILGIPDSAPLTPQEAEARVAKESTEPFLIADIAEEVEYDEDFLNQENLDEDAVMDFWLEHSEEEDPSKRYLPAVWAEATHRWNRNSPEQKETIRRNKEQELRADYGITSEEDIQQRITQATTEEAMVAEIANSLYEDDEWLTKSGITKDQLDEHWENTDFDGAAEAAELQSQHLPPVWEEAKRRWNELPPEEKQSRIKKATDDVRAEMVFSAEDAEAVENIGKAIRVLVIVFGALFTLFWGIGSLICTISALVGAFKLGSGMNTAK